MNQKDKSFFKKKKISSKITCIFSTVRSFFKSDSNIQLIGLVLRFLVLIYQSAFKY